jgi:SnoaL-like domain
LSRNTREIFAAIDALDAQAFAGYLSNDIRFQFGNADPAVGHAQVIEAVNGFYSSIKGLTHHISETWDVADDLSVVKIDVEYRRLDGEVVYVPNVDILRWDGDLVADWQIYIDVAAVYAPINEVATVVRSLAPAEVSTR